MMIQVIMEDNYIYLRGNDIKSLHLIIFIYTDEDLKWNK